MALPIKNSARLNDKARSVNLTRHYTFRLNLDSPFREDDAVKVARDHDVISFNLAFDLCRLAENQTVA